jgi:hypothetical protein
MTKRDLSPAPRPARLEFSVKRRPAYPEPVPGDVIRYLGLGAFARKGLSITRLRRQGVQPHSSRAKAIDGALMDVLGLLATHGVLVQARGRRPGGGGNGRKPKIKKVACALVRSRIKKNGNVECTYRCTNGRWLTVVTGKGKGCKPAIDFKSPF